ncbi:MAG: hypothetical protein ACRDRL_01685 [Sciscionella sp.]
MSEQEREALRFGWTPDAADWVDALRATVPMVRWAEWFAAAFALFGLVLLVLGHWGEGVFGVLVAAVIVLLPRWQALRALRDDPLAASTVQALADEQGLQLSIGSTPTTELRWQRVPAWRMTRRCVLLLGAGPGTASPRAGTRAPYAIPLRAFDDPADLQRFQLLLRSGVGEAQ